MAPDPRLGLTEGVRAAAVEERSGGAEHVATEISNLPEGAWRVVVMIMMGAAVSDVMQGFRQTFALECGCVKIKAH